jgi:hypothetical protein
MNLSRDQINRYLNLFKACGKNIVSEPYDGQWYNGKRFAVNSSNRNYNNPKCHKFYNELRDACRGKNRVFDGVLRRDYNISGCAFNVYTNDDGLLTYMLHHPDSNINYVRYTSEQYDTEIAKLGGVPFDIKFKRVVNPAHLYKCYIRSTNANDGDESLRNLGIFIQGNPEYFQIEKFLLGRIVENGRVWASDYYFYCSDLDTLTMAILAGGNSIRKIYKSVQKEEQQ